MKLGGWGWGGEVIEKFIEVVVIGYMWLNFRRGGWKAVFKFCILYSGFGFFIFFYYCVYELN